MYTKNSHIKHVIVSTSVKTNAECITVSEILLAILVYKYCS